MKVTPLDIRKQEFKTTFKGYDKHEVDIFLEMVAKEMEELIRENNTLIEQVRELDAKIEDYRRMEKTLQDTLMSAQKTTDELRRNAEKEAELIIKNAKMQADEIIQQAKQEVQSLMNQISALKTQRDGFIAQMRGVLQSQLRMLDEISTGKTVEPTIHTRQQRQKQTSEEGYRSIGDLFKER